MSKKRQRQLCVLRPEKAKGTEGLHHSTVFYYTVEGNRRCSYASRTCTVKGNGLQLQWGQSQLGIGGTEIHPECGEML